MHEAVKLLLSRMESNPQEFDYEGGKWRTTIESHTRWMSKEEREAVNAKLRNINLDGMRTRMLKRILTDEQRSNMTATAQSAFGSAPMKAEGTAITYPTVANNTWATMNIGNETLSATDLREFKELIEELRARGEV